MAEESGTPARTIDIRLSGTGTVGEAEVRELTDGITQAVGGAVQSWGERMKERTAAAKSAQPPPCP